MKKRRLSDQLVALQFLDFMEEMKRASKCPNRKQGDKILEAAVRRAHDDVLSFVAVFMELLAEEARRDKRAK